MLTKIRVKKVKMYLGILKLLFFNNLNIDI